MAFIKIKCDPGKVVKDLENMRKGTIVDILNLTRSKLREAVEYLKARHFSGPTSETSVRSLTGKLRRSIKIVGPTIQGDKVTGGITIGDSETPYAPVHVGGPRGRVTEIKPKKAGGSLAIPTEFARTARGVPRGWPSDNIWGPTFIYKGIIWGTKRGTKREYATIQPLFILKKKVEVKTRIDPKEDVVKTFLPLIRDEIKLLIKFSKYKAK